MKSRWSIALIALLALALCALAAVSYAGKCDHDQKLTIEQLPAAVRATLENQAQGNPIQDLEKETENGVTFYSADIIQGDKKLGVEIAEDGTLLSTEPEAIGKDDDEDEADEENETEVKVTFDQLPAPVQATLKAEAGSGTIGEIEQETEDGKVVYEAEITKDGKQYDVEIAADGTLIESEADEDDKDDD